MSETESNGQLCRRSLGSLDVKRGLYPLEDMYVAGVGDLGVFWKSRSLGVEFSCGIACCVYGRALSKFDGRLIVILPSFVQRISRVVGEPAVLRKMTPVWLDRTGSDLCVTRVPVRVSIVIVRSLSVSSNAFVEGGVLGRESA